MRVSCVGFCAALALLAGCASPGAPGGPTPLVLRQAAGSSRATPACAGSRIGQAQCGVLVEPGGAHPSYAGLTASQLEKAYDLPSSTKGKGQIVAVVDAYDNPDAANDFAKYRSGMGLPAGTIEKYNQEGSQSNYPTGSPNWGVEIDLDIEMASASCPLCKVYLVEANSNQWSDLEAAVTEAVKLGATIVSNSYDGSGGSCSSYDTKGVEYVASAGDAGYGIYDPAACDSVVAVGGTQLQASGNKRGYTETPWSDSGGGCATGEKKPWWQLHSKYAKNCAGRLANDVSAVAVDVAEYDSYDEGGWVTVDGTSISSPFVGGVFGLAGNSTKQDGGRTFWLPYRHHLDLYEIGGVRYSTVGGWGSPKGIGAF
ncbi:MAG TPA: S8 family serine peptidase [Candidatus Cybelea sp.]|nr:S8 family serine peptidase [Candidatus Cybelea sp.]